MWCFGRKLLLYSLLLFVCLVALRDGNTSFIWEGDWDGLNSLQPQYTHVLSGLAWWGQVCANIPFPNVLYKNQIHEQRRPSLLFHVFFPVFFFFTRLTIFFYFKCSVKVLQVSFRVCVLCVFCVHLCHMFWQIGTNLCACGLWTAGCSLQPLSTLLKLHLFIY